ncbi:MAG: YggS family pyridoxal phosphate-dependent enzyme [Candidatus Bipolaricaulota bacterium]|nr:MAG: YggS family pyridoxal phosphate-dependent enzyme [Candidatus Bipolaricaulota bacterium]
MNGLETQIRENVERVLETIPSGVLLVAAVKGRSLEEIRAVVSAGVTHLGCNYVQQAEDCAASVEGDVTWHLIGHLQRNKARRAASLFDIVETVDSPRLARALDAAAERAGRRLPVLIEVNSGREATKAGVLPEDVDALADLLAQLPHLALRGLMTLGPMGDPEAARACFRETRKRFLALRGQGARLPEMDTLSMGMSDSYAAAIDEGATEVRLGRAIFAPQAAEGFEPP